MAGGHPSIAGIEGLPACSRYCRTAPGLSAPGLQPLVENLARTAGLNSPAPAKPIAEQAVNAHPGTAQVHAQDLEDDPIEETQRSVGAIDAALCAQGFRWR